MRWSVVPVTATVVAAIVMLRVDRAVAQDATPVASPIATVACAVEPRPTDELLALWFGPGGAPVETPGSSGTAVPELTLPQGEPADEETVAAVDATAREFFACFATDQNTRAFALMTDDLVRLFVPSDTLEQTRVYLEHLEIQAVGTPAAEAEEITVAPVRDVRVLEDGRVGAILKAEEGTLFLFLERQGGRWLVDGFVEVDPEGTPVTET